MKGGNEKGKGQTFMEGMNGEEGQLWVWDNY